jgi:hypothetical protein
MSVKARMIKFLEYLAIGQDKFERSVGLSRGFVNNIGDTIRTKSMEKIISTYPQLNPIWLQTGIGNMLQGQSDVPSEGTTNIIPFYDDITTIGGMNTLAESGAVYKPTEYINTGDWFRDATAALRHYGDSMVEYPSGCILALKEVKDKSLLIWGEDYVIETSEYRITKKVQRGPSKEFVTAYSTNTETHPDGRQIYEPIDIPIDSARFLLVLGYVVKKKNGGMMVFSNDKK